MLLLQALLSLSHPPCASSAPFPPPRRRSGGGTGLAPCGACATSAIQQWEETGNRATGGCKLTVVTPKRLAERGGGEAGRLRLRLRRRLQQRGRWRRSALPPYPPTSTPPPPPCQLLSYSALANWTALPLHPDPGPPYLICLCRVKNKMLYVCSHRYISTVKCM